MPLDVSPQDGQGPYATSTLGSPEFDAKILREADLKVRAMTGDQGSLVDQGTHCQGHSLSLSPQEGLLHCSGCQQHFNRNNIHWGCGAVILSLTAYEMDDGNAAEAGRRLFEALSAHLETFSPSTM